MVKFFKKLGVVFKNSIRLAAKLFDKLTAEPDAKPVAKPAAKPAAKLSVSRKSVTIDDGLFDPSRKMLWLRGQCKFDNIPLDCIRIYHKNKRLGEAIARENFDPGGQVSHSWKFESHLNHEVRLGDEVSVTAIALTGVTITAKFTIPAPNPVAVHDDNYLYAETGSPYYILDILNDNVDSRCDKKVLLILHNLHLPESLEKRKTLTALREAMNRKGLELILFHHSRHSAGCAIPEVNFFAGNETLKPFQFTFFFPPPISYEGLRYAQRMLYGFNDSTKNRMSLSQSKGRVEEEAIRLETVIQILQPSLILCWHQWISTTIIGRELAEAHNIPSAFLHEGMLPGSMTLDHRGMMAESHSVGAMLNPEDPEALVYQEKADQLISHVRSNKLERKAHKGTVDIEDVLRTAKSNGWRTVFYAGINDWHSGNLPADHPRAKIHSPFYRDTDEGLQALLSLAEEHDFFVLFKPHPIIYPHLYDSHERLATIHEATGVDCILATDITVTLLSSISYLSLTHEKPTVLLGRNTMSGTGAAYELSSRENLADCLEAAFAAVDMPGRIDNYRWHVAALLKDHLYSYGEPKEHIMLNYDNLVDKLLALMQDNS